MWSNMCLLARKRREEAIAASSDPNPSGAPQTVYGATATFHNGSAAGTAAAATAAATPPQPSGLLCEALFARAFEGRF